MLDKLISMQLVEKTYPINDENNKRKAEYRIKDNFTLFYYRYIFKYSSQIKIMDSDVFYNKHIDKDFEEYYVSKQFEVIAKEYLIRMNKKGLITPVIEKIGKYYYDDEINHKNGEFDVVTLDEKGYKFYEVKFRNSNITKNMINKEIEQINQTGLNCYKYAFISKSKFENIDEENVETISLDKLYSVDLV